MATDITTATPAVEISKPEIVLYWLEKSRSQRILWLLEELNLPYKLEIFHRNKETHLAPPELKKIHPLGKSPVISITPPGATEAVIVAESALIIEYLIEHFGQNTTLSPKHWKDGLEGKIGGETAQWTRYKYFLHYGEGSLMPLMVIAFITKNIKSSPVPFFIKPVTSAISSKIHAGFLDPNLKTHFGFLEEQLKTSPDSGSYLCGPHLTGADLLLSYPLIAAKGRSPLLTAESYPTLFKYIGMLEEEPGYKKAVEKIVEIEGKFEAFG